jgi:WD40 repeat protein
MMTSRRRFRGLSLLAAFILGPACHREEPAPVEAIAYDADGSLLTFTASGIHVFDAALKRETKTIPFDGLPVTTRVDAYRYGVSADRHLAAVSFPATDALPQNGFSGQTTIALFDLSIGRLLKTFRLDDATPYGHAQGVVEMKLSAHADLIVASSHDGTSPGSRYDAVVVDVATGQPLWKRNVEGFQMPVFSPDGTLLIVQNVASRRLEALEARTGATVYSVDLPRRLWALTMTGDGKLAGLVGPPDDQPCPEPGSCPPTVALWSPADGTLLAEFPGVEQTNTFGTNPNGEAALWCSRWGDLCATGIIDFSLPEQMPVLRVWRTDGTPVTTLAMTSLNTVTFSPDGRYVGTADHPGTAAPVQVFRIADGTRVGALNSR